MAEKPLDKLNRDELNARARAAGVEDPEQYDSKADVIAAIDRLATPPSADALPVADGIVAPEDALLTPDAVAPDADPDPATDAPSGNVVPSLNGRVERFETTRPSGERVVVTRNLDTGAQEVVGVGVPMLPGDPKEPTGPEDALGPGPTRGDYRDRIGSGSYHPHTSVPIENPEPGGPTSRLVPQRPFAEDIGDAAGLKGGVDTANLSQG